MSAADLKVLWNPPKDLSGLQVGKFMEAVNKGQGLSLSTHQDLYEWSISDLETFWRYVFEFAKPLISKPYHTVYEKNVKMPDVPKFFVGCKLNYAQNLIDNPYIHKGLDNRIAVVNVREDGSSRRVTYTQLRNLVGRYEVALKQQGVEPLDRIAIVSSNSLECLSIYLATISMGAIVSTISADMGIRAILSRLSQINAKIVFGDNAVLYNGKIIDQTKKMEDVLDGLNKDGDVTKLILIPNIRSEKQKLNTKHVWYHLDDVMKTVPENVQPEYVQVEISYPVLIVFSSGTTGEPKCIVHGSGSLFSRRKEQILNQDVIPGKDVLLQYTTTAWIMYVGLVSALCAGTSIIVYDGSPLYDVYFLPKLIEKYGVTIFGTSPRYLMELQRRGIKPKETFNLDKLRLVTSTGSALTTPTIEGFYRDWPSNVCVTNMIGGTETGCNFCGGGVSTPVYAGVTSSASFGMSVKCYNEDGQHKMNESGELICDQPWPSMPVKFWGPNGKQAYFSAYFEKFPNVWAHGDFIKMYPTGPIDILGRSDGTLNPSGVRFGSADIYNVVEKYDKEIADSICVGQRRAKDDFERVLLFIKMKENDHLTPQLIEAIKKDIRQDYSARHVPYGIFQVPDIPYTHNGKKMETLVKKLLQQGDAKIPSSTANPQSLDYFRPYYNIESQMRQHKL